MLDVDLVQRSSRSVESFLEMQKFIGCMLSLFVPGVWRSEIHAQAKFDKTRDTIVQHHYIVSLEIYDQLYRELKRENWAIKWMWIKTQPGQLSQRNHQMNLP